MKLLTVTGYVYNGYLCRREMWMGGKMISWTAYELLEEVRVWWKDTK